MSIGLLAMLVAPHPRSKCPSWLVRIQGLQIWQCLNWHKHLERSWWYSYWFLVHRTGGSNGPAAKPSDPPKHPGKVGRCGKPSECAVSWARKLVIVEQAPTVKYRKRLTCCWHARPNPLPRAILGAGLKHLGLMGFITFQNCTWIPADAGRKMCCIELLDHHAGQIRTAPVQAIQIVAEQKNTWHLAGLTTPDPTWCQCLLQAAHSREMQHIGLRNLWLPAEAAPLAGQKLCWMPRRQEQIVTNLQLTWSVILWSGFPSPSIFHLPSCMSGWWFSPSESLVLHNHRTRE